MTPLPVPRSSKNLGQEMESERKHSRLEVEPYDLEILLRRPSLRSNIPRKSFQVRRETIQTEETTCGIGCIRNEWIQSFANRNAFIFIYGVLGTFYGSYHAYFNGSITTLEKRFRLPSQTVGLIATTGGTIQIIASLILSFRTSKAHAPKWIGLGTYLIIASTIITASPNFLYGPGFNHERFKNSTYQKDTFEVGRELCSRESELCVYHTKEKNASVIILIVAQILHGIGGSLYLTMGKSYKDDNIGKYQGPTLSSFLSILTTLGPAFGYWLSSVCLKLFVSPEITPVLGEDDPRWLGAWWLGNLIIGFMLLLLASLIILFPTELPKTAVRRVFEGEKTKRENYQETKDKINFPRHFFIFTIFYCIDFNGIFDILGYMAYFTFLPKYIETQYRVFASNANLIAGSITLIFSALGTAVASSVIIKNHPCAKIQAGWNVLVGLLSIGSLISYIHFGCHANDEQIKAMAAQLSNTSNLKCEYNQFSPVCDNFGKSFISPCHAGCEYVYYFNNTKATYDCIGSQPHTNKTATPGICPVDCHFNFLMFIIITCSTAFTYATSRTSNIWLEILYKEKKEILNGFNFGKAFFSIIAFTPLPILFGYILDKYCLLWDDNSFESGNCWLYDNEKLRLIMNLTSVGIVIVGIILDVGALFLLKDQELFEYNDYYSEND